jgi:hypothetical protein
MSILWFSLKKSVNFDSDVECDSENYYFILNSDERSKREFEAGRIDWMGAHQSDKIINRLKKIIRND